MNVVIPLASASYTCCGLMKWMCASMPPAVRMSPSPAIASVVTPTTMPAVTPAITSGLPALPMPAMRPCLMPTSAFRMPVQSTMSAFVITQSSASASGTPAAWPMPSLRTLPPPNLHSSPYTVASALDLGDQPRVGQPHPIPGRGPEDVGVVLAPDAVTSSARIPSRSVSVCDRPARPPVAAANHSRAGDRHERDGTAFSPGSKRTAVPAGMSRRLPYAARRSKTSARLVSMK